MAEFAKYFVVFMVNFGKNVVKFFENFFMSFGEIFVTDIPNYFSSFIKAAASFDAWGWISFILVAILSILFWFFVIFRLVQVIRRYIVFRAKEVEKDQLLEEIAKTKDQVAKLTIEKNQIYAMKMNGGHSYITEGEVGGEDKENKNDEDSSNAPAPVSRFAKLIAIDKKYEYAEPYISSVDENELTLSKIVDLFVNFAASQLKFYYSKDHIRQFLAGMSVTKVLILEGISGTGKTSLPYALGKFFSHDTSIISVQPSWRDRADLVGYLNEFTKTFNETDFICSLYESTYVEDPTFVILDEMNLARIEYYFAEFLSIMEMPDSDEWKINIVPSPDESDPKHFVDGKITVPQSIWFIGTANQDDSTFTITDKVYDRTITLDINKRAEYFDAPLTPAMKIPYDYLALLFQKAKNENAISEKAVEKLRKVDAYMLSNFKITFGNRILKQIYNFVPVYIACGGTEEEAIDFLLMSKIFRKLNAINLMFLKKELNGLIALLDNLFGKNQMAKSIDFINELIKKA